MSTELFGIVIALVAFLAGAKYGYIVLGWFTKKKE